LALGFLWQWASQWLPWLLLLFAASAVEVGAATKATDNRPATILLLGDFRVDTLQIASTPAAFNAKKRRKVCIPSWPPGLHSVINLQCGATVGARC
jgi:hypothetical protein